VQEAGKIVIMRNWDFVGKGYRSGGLHVLNAAAQVNNETATNSVYIVESVDLWHGRLGHVSFASLKRLRNMRLVPNMNIENCSKCPICVEAKFVKKSFKSLTTRKTDLLELVHSDLEDFKNTMSRGEKKWYLL